MSIRFKLIIINECIILNKKKYNLGTHKQVFTVALKIKLSNNKMNKLTKYKYTHISHINGQTRQKDLKKNVNKI